MDSVFQNGASQSVPQVPTGETTEGNPTNGSVSSGISATIIGDHWYYAVTQEILNLIRGANIVPKKNIYNQMFLAVKKMCDEKQTDYDTKILELNRRISALEVTPTGLICFFPYASPPNTNWLICDGRAVSRLVYETLFSKIGTRYGAGDGSTTFNVPDLIGRVAWGASSGIGTKIGAGLPNITGTFNRNDLGRGEAIGTGAFIAGGAQSRTSMYDSAGSQDGFSFDASRSNSIYGASSTVQPPALSLLPCIHI